MQGTLTTGAGEAAGFVAAVEDGIRNAIGFRPYAGTFNLRGLEPIGSLPSVDLPEAANDVCDGAVLRPCRIGGVRAAVLRPLVPEYPEGKAEVVAPVHLRSVFAVEEGVTVPVTPPDEPAPEPAAVGGGLDEFDAVVFDLDGTLVDLAVDWATVHDEIEAALDGVLDGGLESYRRHEVFDLARDAGRYDALDEILDRHEVGSVPDSTPCPPGLAALRSLDRPAAVCTANAVAAAEGALERFGVADAVDVIVGRNTVPEDKPHPRPLERALEGLGVDAGNAAFVGDEPTDAGAAVATGTSYLHPDQLPADV